MTKKILQSNFQSIPTRDYGI